MSLWYSTTTTLHTIQGKLSISLWDLKQIGGLQIYGLFDDKIIPFAKELNAVREDNNPILPQSH